MTHRLCKFYTKSNCIVCNSKILAKKSKIGFSITKITCTQCPVSDMKFLKKKIIKWCNEIFGVTAIRWVDRKRGNKQYFDLGVRYTTNKDGFQHKWGAM
jgi:hypothetical protein